eukprot:3446208-Rhodomonas_salina.1
MPGTDLADGTTSLLCAGYAMCGTDLASAATTGQPRHRHPPQAFYRCTAKSQQKMKKKKPSGKKRGLRTWYQKRG